MSQKELLYLEDALSHEKAMQNKCNFYASQIQDADIKSFVQQLATRHQQNFSKIYQLLRS